VGFEKFLDWIRFAAASEASNMNEGNGAGDGYVKLGIESEEGVSGLIRVKWVNVGHDSVEAVFHVRDEVFGAADVRAI